MTDPPKPGFERDLVRLSDLPRELRAHPLFRQGYNRGYSDRSHEEFLAERLSGSGLATAIPTGSPPSFDVTAGGLRHRLAPGVTVARDLSALTAEFLSTETPCCGRGITLAVPQPERTRQAICCRCRVLFAVCLIQEEPDGFGDDPQHVAIFVVEQTDVAVALHRAGRWEKPPRKPRKGSP